MLVQFGNNWIGLRPRPIFAALGIFFIQLFPNKTACSPITYTNNDNDDDDAEVVAPPNCVKVFYCYGLGSFPPNFTDVQYWLRLFCQISKE